MALALAGGCSSDSTPSLGTSIYHESGPRNGKKTKKKKKSYQSLDYLYYSERGCKEDEIISGEGREWGQSLASMLLPSIP